MNMTDDTKNLVFIFVLLFSFVFFAVVLIISFAPVYLDEISRKSFGEIFRDYPGGQNIKAMI